MILVDSSVWIDFFNGKNTPQTQSLNQLLEHKLIIMGDLVLTEVLQGFEREADYKKAMQLLLIFPIVTLGGKQICVKAAENYRLLRKKGVKVRGAVDLLIATYVIENQINLLFSDRDFEPMVKYLGLRSAMAMH